MRKRSYPVLQQALEGRRIAWGVHCFSADMEMYELAGQLGYDYVWIDSEHAANTRVNIKNGIIAAHAGGCAAVVRAGGLSRELITPIAAMEPEGIIVPHVDTVEQAERAVELCTCRYRAGAAERPMVMLQCESGASVENLQDIVKVPGLDIVIIGPMDLASSLGYLHDNKNPRVIEAFEQIVKVCTQARKPFGLSIGYDLEMIRWFAQRGIGFVSMGQHVTYFRMMSREALRQLKTGGQADRS